MACVRIPMPDGGYAIACGVRVKKRELCRFCGDTFAVALCDYPVKKPVKINHLKLRPDDIVVTQQNRYELAVQVLTRWEIRGGVWRRSNGRGKKTCTMTQYGLTFPDGRSWLYRCVGCVSTSDVTVLRPGTCDAPCCERCHMNRGPNFDVCREHADMTAVPPAELPEMQLFFDLPPVAAGEGK